MSLKRSTILAAFGAPLVAVFLFVSPVLAAEASSTLAADNIDQLTPEEKLTSAKDDLTKALDLSLKKVDSVRTRLNELNFPELSREAKLKKDYLEDLESYTKYYNGAKENVGKKESLDEVKDLAKEIKDYRDTTYVPGMERIVRFALVFYNEEVLGVANDRLDKVEADVKKLDKLGVVKASDFEGKLNEVDKLLDEAAKLQAEAKKIILVATSTEVTKEKRTSKEMIETSLNNVKMVYDIFLDLNQVIKKSLGL